MTITLNFDTFAAWVISSEIESASRHPNLLDDAVRSHMDNPTGTPDLEAFLELADDLIADMRDDLVANHERLILISDRAAEYYDEVPVDVDGENWDSQLTMDISGWLDDDRLTRALGEAYKAQWEFNTEIAKLVIQRERATRNMLD